MKRIILFFSLIVFSFFISVTGLFAEEIENYVENNTSNEIEEIKTDTENKKDISKPSLKDIFGDEQTFPFVAGFGKNVAN